ncbi:hypothetical protein ACHAWF_006683 [Thalassiosira exigua]
MAPPIVQVSGPRQKKKKVATINPLFCGSLLLVMYAAFVYLVMSVYDDDASMDSGAAYHLRKSMTRTAKSLSRKAGAEGVESKGKMVNRPKVEAEEGKTSAKEPNQKPKKSVNVHPDLVHFCGECTWRDTLITCDERVAWEMDKRKITEFEAKKKNLLYCTKTQELHVSDYCGTCQWKGTEFSCDERVAFEVERNKLSKIDAQKRNLAHCKRPPYILSPLCGGCARAVTNLTSKMYRFGIPCHDRMFWRMKQGKASSMNDAARMVAEEYEGCSQCHPDICWHEYFEDASQRAGFENKRGYLTKYWRYDQAAPEISSPITLALTSIPKEFRIPPSRFHGIEAFLTEKYNEFESSNDTTHVPIFIEYNPGLTPIPPKMKKNLPKYAAYAMALRVTPANNCFRRDQMSGLPQKVWDHTMMSATNLLGISLLDEEYEILPGYDVVVDIATQLGFQKDGYGTTYFGEPTFMDYRLFTLNDQIYLHANADVTVVTNLDIRSRRHRKEPKEGEFKLDVVFGDGRLEVTMLHQFNTIWSGGDRGKNFALFAVPNSTHPNEPDSVYAEVDINPYHRVQQLYLDEVEMLERKIVKKRIRRNYAVDKIMMRKVRANGNLTDSEIEPKPSFFSVEDYWFPGAKPAFRRAGHGGACCISLSRNEALAQGEHNSLTHKTWGDNDYLLVGVAHTSVVWKRWHSDKSVPNSQKALVPHTHYVSFFYAFEPRPPFNLRARSGYFCLGFAGEDGAEGGVFNPHSVLTVNRKLSQMNETFSCPQIHFVSSFVEKVGDASQSLIGYGINDCTPRLVEVSKKEISRMLFSDPWDMKLEHNSSEYDWDRAEALPLNTASPW